MSTKSKIGIAALAITLFLLACVNAARPELTPEERVDSIDAEVARVPAVQAGASVSPSPNPDPGDSISAPDDRMIQGPYPVVGNGADVLKACAPEGGGAWDVAVLRVTEASISYDPNPNTLRGILAAGLPVEPDLVVIVFDTGGLSAGNIDHRSQSRRSCVVYAGMTAPEAYFVMGGINVDGRRGPTHDVFLRGLGFTADRRTNVPVRIGQDTIIARGAHGSNQVQAICAPNSHFDQISASFATDDILSVTHDGCGNRFTFVRNIVGPSAGQNAGRAGGIFPGGGGPPRAQCGLVSLGTTLYFEAMRRSPLIGCGDLGPVNVTNIVAYNATDLGRIQKANVSLNLRGLVSIGGPITGCARDRGVTWWDGTIDPSSPAQIYLHDVTVLAPAGCSWTETTTLWGGQNTVFHFATAGTAVPFEGKGVLTPHPDPEHPIQRVASAEVVPHVLANAGANFRLACDGRYTRRLNALDAASLGRIARGEKKAFPGWNGLVEYEAEVGRLEFSEGSPCSDINDNGIPNEAEIWLSGSPTGIPDVGELAPDGRPLILHYLSGR